MPAVVVPKGAFQVGPGYLYRAVLGSSLPTNTVAGSVFTDAWPVAWVPVGITTDGTTDTYQLNTANVEAAEYLDPLSIQETGRTVTVAFNLMNITNKGYQLAMNGGTQTTVSGTGATLLTKLVPPVVGASVRTMLGWESNDGTERAVWYQCFQGGSVATQRQKAPNAAALPLTFTVEQPATGDPFDRYFAGASRVLSA